MDKQIETPLYQVYYKYHGVIKKIQVKDESKNISGSIKDRPARMIIEDAYQKRLINQDTTICEVTSGNMGIALATIAKDYGNKVIICMPKFMSQERKEILNHLGVKLILTKSFEEAFKIADELAIKHGVFLTKQFENPNNAKAYIAFCKELEKKTNEFPAVIAGVGTGGTINGIGHYLKEKYQMEEEDFLSAEIEVVPAGPARDCGLDRSMIAGYGHDDRVCAYPSFAAMMEAGHVDRTSCCLLVDKEEIGSVGATGMQSMFFENTVAEILALMGQDSNLAVRRTLARSRMLSSDVSAAYDPAYAEAFEKKNCAYFGKGMVINKYTGARGKSGSNDANAEYLGILRKAFDDAKVEYQTAELGRIDAGGGGTIAYIPAAYGMDVIDIGVPILNMHAPYEVSSKADVYETTKCYKAFYEM